MKDLSECRKEKIQSKNKNSRFKCWICRDQGMVFFNKYEHGIQYEFAYRCTCLKGQTSSKRIMTVPLALAENIAMENYNTFIKTDSDQVSEFKEGARDLEESTIDFNISLFEKTQIH